MISQVVTVYKKLRDRVCHAILAVVVMGQMALAHADVDLSNFRSSSGAGSRKFSDQSNGWLTEMNSAVKVFLAACTLAGIVIFVVGMKAANKAKREDRDVPPSASWGMGIGAALTCVPILLGFLANTLATE